MSLPARSASACSSRTNSAGQSPARAGLHLCGADPLEPRRPLAALLGSDHVAETPDPRRSRPGLPAVRRLRAVAGAWRYIFVDLGRDTLRPYINSVVVALASTILAVLFGSARRLRAGAHHLPREDRGDRHLPRAARRDDRRASALSARPGSSPLRSAFALFIIFLIDARRAASAARSATTTSSSGSSPTASCRRSSRCCRST